MKVTRVNEEAVLRQRPWDNSGLRRRVEGRTIEGVDVLSLQSSVLVRTESTPRRRFLRSR